MPIFTINALSMDGRGIVRHGENGKTTFVSGALPGDRVEVTITREHRGYCEGRVTTLIEKAPDTIEPACPHAHTCGGCSLQRLPYDAQLAAKEQFVLEALTRIGKIANPPLRPIVASPDVLGYRNRVQLAFARNLPLPAMKKARYTLACACPKAILWFQPRAVACLPAGQKRLCRRWRSWQTGQI